VNSHLIWLAVLMGVNSIIGAYYYLRLIVVMYMREGQRGKRWRQRRGGFPMGGECGAGGLRRLARCISDCFPTRC